MNKTLFILLLNILPFGKIGLCSVEAQTVLSLDSCRAMALRNNKLLLQKKFAQNAARYNRKSMRTMYLPKVDALGTYQYYSKEISILNTSQKAALGSLGTTAMTSIQGNAAELLGPYLSEEQMQKVGQMIQELGGPTALNVNSIGQSIVDATRTDTRNIWAGTVMVRQPIFMGGAIVAANKIADIMEDMTKQRYEGDVQNTLYNTDQVYWMVVSLKQKKALAESYSATVKKFDEDVKKIIKQGLATKSQGLKVDVKVNECDMTLLKVNNGLSLAKMLLCQQCGLPLDTDITLVDENTNDDTFEADIDAFDNVSPQEYRAELKLLESTVKLGKQAQHLALASSLPQVALTGGYIFSNPNLLNGFEKKFNGVWNVGVELRIPVWNWLDGVHKVKVAKAVVDMVQCQLDEAREKIDLQVTQCRYKLSEAQKRLVMAKKNVESADENLRCANVGFKEGVMETTDVMEAQTAWESAQTDKIDAEIEVRMAQVNLKKALGILN